MFASSLAMTNAAPWLSRLRKCRRYVLPGIDTRSSHGLSPRFPVDAVVTWVDGADPEFIRQRSRYQSASNSQGGAQARYISNGEIDFVILSLLRFMPWLRKIFIVTAFGQRPRITDYVAEKIQLIDHQEILPTRALPTFNSHSIECGLAAIPGLSDRFLYVNDDTFIGRRVSPMDMLAANGAIRLRHDFARPPKKHVDHPYLGSIANSEACLTQHLGVSQRWMIHHQVRMVTRQGLREAERLFPEPWEQTLLSRFRAKNNISPMHLAHYLDLAAGRGIVADDMLSALVYSSDEDFAQKLERIQIRRPFFFCINDGDGFNPSNHRRGLDFLQNYYLGDSV